MMSKNTIFVAKQIITMNPNVTQATYVAVRDGRILGVGTLDELKGWGDYELDTIFADKVLMPGLIEGHAHAFAGALWAYPYVGSHDRIGPDGKLWKGCKSVEEVVARLKETETMLTEPDEPVLAWGLDPIYFTGPSMIAVDLDRVSSTRPVLVAHLSFHLLNVNSVVLNYRWHKY